MTEEIKEILEEIKEKNEAYEECSENGIIENEYYKSHLLLNYITNLQKENEKKDAYIKYLEEYNPKYYKGKIFYGDGREIYKSRNEKAVEYIKENDGYAISRNYYDKKLLNILQGGDEE